MTETTLRGHTSQEFEAELEEVRQKLLAMGRQVDQMVEAAGRALVGHDVRLANRIIVGDTRTDELEMEIDHLCLGVLARRQPVAGDLRLLTSALKLVVDLERIGDLGVSIASRVVELGDTSPLIPYDGLVSMLGIARGMLSEALTALVTADAARAQHVIERDESLDVLYATVFEQVIGRVRDGSADVGDATRLQAISKYIERIGDHAVNLAQHVIFVVTGEDVRHLARARRSMLS